MIPLAITNYLDDFLFIKLCFQVCNGMVKNFLVICEDLGCPVSMEKTVYASPLMEFLGVLLDGRNKILAIPEEKICKATDLLKWALDKHKVTIKFIQQITGTLNFLNKVIVPGCAFTRGMYIHLKTTDSKG